MTPPRPQRLVLASGNGGKLRELRELLAEFDINLCAQGELGVDDAEETGLSFVENAILKARHAARITGLPALADDSGLCVTALKGAPGLYSARFAGAHGDHEANNAKLLAELEHVPDAARSAFFICALAWVSHADDPAPMIAEGRWMGRILRARQGHSGFGYDPLFLPHGQQASAALLEPAVKNRVSHRGQALNTLKARLRAA